MDRSVRRDNRMASTAARRSPRTRVRSDASMATSVPVPIARPRSAWARAAASLTPSPTIATTLPSACSRLTTSTLSAGNTSAMTRPGASALPAGSSVMPTSAAIACARSAGRSGTRSASSRARPTYTVWPSTTPCTPTPSTLPNPVTGGSAPTRSAALAAMARAMGCSDPASTAPASRSTSSGSAPSTATMSTSVMRPVVTVPVLSSTTVSTRRVDLGTLDEYAELSAPAGADQQRGRRGQAKRARAGDDEHRDGSGERRGRPGAGTQPEPQRCDGDGDDDRHEHGRDAVGQPLHRGLAGLRLLNQAGHLRELRVRADPSGPYHEPAAGVDRGPDDHVAGADLHRHGLTGEHRGVHRRCTGLNHAVSGDLLPGPYHERVADGELLDRHPHLNAAAEHGHVLGAEFEQRA